MTVPAKLCGLDFGGKRRSWQGLLHFKKIKLVVTIHFSAILNLALIWEKIPYIIIYFKAFYNHCCLFKYL